MKYIQLSIIFCLAIYQSVGQTRSITYPFDSKSKGSIQQVFYDEANQIIKVHYANPYGDTKESVVNWNMKELSSSVRDLSENEMLNESGEIVKLAPVKLYTKKFEKGHFTYELKGGKYALHRIETGLEPVVFANGFKSMASNSGYYIVNKQTGAVSEKSKSLALLEYPCEYSRSGCGFSLISPDESYLLDLSLNWDRGLIYNLSGTAMTKLHSLGYDNSSRINNLDIRLESEKENYYEPGLRQVQFSEDSKFLNAIMSYSHKYDFKLPAKTVFCKLDLEQGEFVYKSDILGVEDYKSISSNFWMDKKGSKLYALFYYDEKLVDDKTDGQWLRMYDFDTFEYQDYDIGFRKGNIIGQSDSGQYLFVLEENTMHRIDLKAVQPAKDHFIQRPTSDQPSAVSSTELVLSYGPQSFSTDEYYAATGNQADKDIAYVCLVAHTATSKYSYDTYMKRLNSAKGNGNPYAWEVAKATLDMAYGLSYSGGDSEHIRLYGQRLSAIGVPASYGEAIPSLINYCSGYGVTSGGGMTLQEYGAQIRAGIKAQSNRAAKQSRKIYNQDIDRRLKRGENVNELIKKN